jgi:hypothetical protein
MSKDNNEKVIDQILNAIKYARSQEVVANIDNYSDDEILAEAWLSIESGVCKSSDDGGNMMFSVRKAVRSLQQQTGVTKPTTYAFQLNQPELVPDPTQEQEQANRVHLAINDAEELYNKIECLEERQMFRHYVAYDCNVDEVLAEFPTHDIESVLDVVSRAKEQLRQEVIRGQN